MSQRLAKSLGSITQQKARRIRNRAIEYFLKTFNEKSGEVFNLELNDFKLHEPPLPDITWHQAYKDELWEINYKIDDKFVMVCAHYEFDGDSEIIMSILYERDEKDGIWKGKANFHNFYKAKAHYQRNVRARDQASQTMDGELGGLLEL